MYVSVPRNYDGVAFKKEERPPQTEETKCTEPQLSEAECEKTVMACEECDSEQKNPLSCILRALRKKDKSGFDSEDFLLIAIIALLVGNEGNEDILLILAMLLLM